MNFQLFSSSQMQALRGRVRPLAAAGRFGVFKLTKNYDGKIGLQQQFPYTEEVPR